MVQSLETRLAFCARVANGADFLADGGKVLEDNGWRKKSDWTIMRKTRTSWSPVCCVS